MKEELSDIFVLNYRKLQQSFEIPLEFSFLDAKEIEDLLNKKTSEEVVMQFFNISFNREEQERLIIKLIEQKAESHKRIDCWKILLQNFGFQLNECWTFEGDSEQWKSFLKNTIYTKEKAIILNPKISFKFDFLSLPVQLQPSAIIYYRQKFTLLLQTYSKNVGKNFFGAFIFYEYFFKNYLSMKFSEAAFFYSPDGENINYQFSIPSTKTPNKNSLKNCYFPIYEVLELPKPNYQESIFSEFLTRTGYDHLFFLGQKNNIQEQLTEFISQIKEFKSQLMEQLKKLDKLATLIDNQLPQKFEIATWYKHIDWTELISIQSLKAHYLEIKRIGLFSAEGKVFKYAISLLYPNLPILWSSLIDIRKAFLLIEKKYFLVNNANLIPFSNFLSYIFYNPKLTNKKENLESSIFTREGKQLFWTQILNIKWKIYYDFESWETMLTQLSLQIFEYERLILKKDLIQNPFSSTLSFHEKCIKELSKPICVELKTKSLKKEEKNKYVELLKNEIVYISFNKTFECTWLEKLSQFFAFSGDIKNSVLCLLIKDLTVDLSDWFKFSAYSSLNIIGPLLGAHTLKKLAEIVQPKSSKKYSQLQWARNGRTASLLYLYFYAEIFNIGNVQKLNNEDLAPTLWIKGYRERNLKVWNFVSSFLTEYCYYDVQNMVDGVNWLKENYEKNKNKIVSQFEILRTISQFKKLSAPQLGELLTSYLQFQSSY